MAQPAAPKVEFFQGIQALRALAALAVVFYHVELGINGWFSPATPLPSSTLGAAGVDLFFVISGFIMTVTAKDLSPSAFVARRLIRIVPLYWASTIVFLLAALVVPQREGQDYSWAATLTSFLFVPYARPDGTMQPLNPVGWTLNYEMFFYAVFAVALSIRRRFVVETASAALVIFTLFGWLVAGNGAVLGFLSSPIILEFVLGMGIARLYLAGYRLPAARAAVLALLALGAFAASWGQPEPSGWTRTLFWGGPSFLLVLAAALGPDPISRGWLTRLGDASYALYLFHLPVLLAFKQIGPRLGLPWQMAATPWLAALAITVATVVLSLAIYAYFELPVTRALRRAFAGPAKEPERQAGSALGSGSPGL